MYGFALGGEVTVSKQAGRVVGQELGPNREPIDRNPFSPNNPVSILIPLEGRRTTYPEQQLPGVPHELGVPQQPPDPGSADPGDELIDML
jgi:hypothetical protein